jgi:hypothetical protein
MTTSCSDRVGLRVHDWGTRPDQDSRPPFRGAALECTRRCLACLPCRALRCLARSDTDDALMAGVCCVLAGSEAVGGGDDEKVKGLGFLLCGKVTDSGVLQIDAMTSTLLDGGHRHSSNLPTRCLQDAHERPHSGRRADRTVGRAPYRNAHTQNEIQNKPI